MKKVINIIGNGLFSFEKHHKYQWLESILHAVLESDLFNKLWNNSILKYRRLCTNNISESQRF